MSQQPNKSVNKTGKKKMTDAEKAARTAALKNESKSAKFIRLATPRVNKALKAIGQIARLGGSQYESTPEQRAAMFKALRDAIAGAEDRFKGVREAKQGFVFQ